MFGTSFLCHIFPFAGSGVCFWSWSSIAIHHNALSSTELEKRKEFLLRMLKHFQYAQRNRTRERWYQNLINKMMGTELFRELWTMASQKLAIEGDITDFAYKSFTKFENSKMMTYNFYFFSMPLFGNPRFYAELYVPANLTTMKYFE